MNWLLKLLFVVIGQILTGFINVLADIINNIFSVMYDINDNLNLDKISSYIVYLSLAFVAFFSVKQLIQVYVLNTEGDPDADPLELITRASISVAVIMCGSWLTEIIIEYASMIANDSSSLITGEKTTFTEIFLSVVKALLLDTTINMFILLLFMVAVLIGFVVFIFQAAKRGAELILFKLLLPIFACDLLTTNKERWNAFFTEFLITTFGYIVQLVCFKIFMLLFVKLNNDLEPKYIFASLGWLMVVLGTPKWLSKFAYSSGIGNATKGGARSATYLIPQLLRK